MRTRDGWSATLLGAGVLFIAACASGGASTETRARPAITSAQGLYRFQLRNGAEVVTEGTFAVMADTVVVHATPGPCRYEEKTTPEGPAIYSCGENTILVDRRDPVRRSTIRYMRMVTTQRSVCTVYQRNAQGREVCTKTIMEKDQVLRPATARLLLMPATSD